MKQIEIISEILDEIRKFNEDRDYFDNETKEYIPGMIPDGNEGGYMISRKAASYLNDLTNSLLGSESEFQKRYKYTDAYDVVSHCLGTAITEINEVGTDSYQDIFDCFKSKIKSIIEEKIIEDTEHVYIFGCSFLNITGLDNLEIGCVKFYRTSYWLNQTCNNETINPKIKEKIYSIVEAQKLTSVNKLDFEIINISKFFKENEWICIVSLKGMGAKFALQNALLAANIALVGISLIWQKPSKILLGLYLKYDTKLFNQEYHFIKKDCDYFLGGGSKSQLPIGEYVGKEVWENLKSKNSFLLEILKLVTEHILSPYIQKPSSQMLETLLLSLIWFREACREQNDMISVVKFCASMDTMARGKSAKGIKNLFKARLGYTDENPAKIGNEDINVVIDRIYSEGRSRSIHGTTTKIFNDFSSDRNLAETLARYCLVTCILWYSENTSCENPDKFAKKD